MASLLARTLHDLNRATPRLTLRAARPSPAELQDAAALREEVALLSSGFIELWWRHLDGFLMSRDAILLAPSASGDGFVTCEALRGEDPVCELAMHLEALIISFGRFTEHTLDARASVQPEAPASAAFRRYRELVARLEPLGTQSPASHAAGNALAGMQVTLALVEVAPKAFAREHGRPMRRDELEALIEGQPFAQLVHAVGASSARVSNALLATLCPDRFAVWSHSLLAMPERERSARRLEFSPHAFAITRDGELDVTLEALEMLRATAAELDTPARTHQIACPAFAAAAGKGDHVFAAFTRWLIAVCRAYLVPRCA